MKTVANWLLAVVVCVCVSCGGGGGGGNTPTAPASNTTTTSSTRVIAMSCSCTMSAEVGQSKTSTLTVSNSGNAALTITSVTSSHAAFTISPSTATVGAGASAAFTVEFKPTTADIYAATLTVVSDATSGTNSLAVASTGTAPSGAPTTTRIIGLSGTLAFGNVNAGSSGNAILTLANTGNAALDVSATSYPVGFTGNFANGTVAAGASRQITVTFSPSTAQAYSGTISMTSNATSGTSTIAVTGTGIGSAGSTRVIGLSGNMAFGSVNVGSSANATLTIANTGNATLTISGMSYPSGFTGNFANGTIAAGASRQVTVTFTPAGAQSFSGNIAVTSDATSGGSTIVVSGTGATASPLTQFGAGRFLVNIDIAASRYFSDPRNGCYWERLSGLGGSLNEIIANDFVGFDAGQSIVDISSSDKAFSTDSDCGTWFSSPRAGLLSNITQGTWLVGSQVSPGTYRANAAYGCYWERKRNFSGSLSGIIANDFVSSAGPQLVTISASDTGFMADDECGTWTRVSSASVQQAPNETPQDLKAIEANHAAFRAVHPVIRRSPR